MKKESFFILALIVAWIWMIIRTFFGWSSINPDITDSGTWFITQITSSWNNITEHNTTGNNSSWNNIIISTDTANSNNRNRIEIKLAMPSYFYTAWRKSFAQDLYKEQNVYINFQLIDDLEILHTSIHENNFLWYDMLLVPYDRIYDISTRNVQFWQDISTAFDPFISTLVNNNTIWFMPFSADPMVMYDTNWYLNKWTFHEISELSYNRTAPKAKAFPIFFWLTYDDSNNEWFYREHQDIVWYALMHYFIKQRDVNDLRIWIDSNLFEQYNTQTLNEILALLTNSIPSCKMYPSICFQLYNFVWIRFWFISDADIVKQFFTKKYSNFLEFSEIKIPFSSLESPVRIRWFISPPSLTDKNQINWVNTFLIQYMHKHNEYSLWNSTLSVFQSEWNSLKTNEFIWTEWYILSEWWYFIKDISNKNIFRDLINYTLSAQDYLKKI